MACRPTTRSLTRQNQHQSSSNTQQVNSNQNQVNNQTTDARSAVTDTPRTFRTDGNKTGVDQLRERIGKEMDQEFLDCSFKHFMEAYLPFVPTKADVADCLARLREATTPDGDPILRTVNFGTDKKPDLRECLADFHDPFRTTEGQLFSRLDCIADVIAKSKINGRELRYQYYDCHHREIQSDIEGSTNKIDACFPPVGCILPKSGETSDTSDRLHTSIIPVACEWKLRKTLMDKKENNLQVVSANVQIMNADARRMFSFGMTIEDDELQLWYFSRSHSTVSHTVDFVQKPAFLVQAFMSFMFATPAEMGYDPTVTFHGNNDYTYTIPPENPKGKTRFFRTRNIISEYRSNNITGRMARVWLVDEVVSNDKSAEPVKGKHQYVLKDVWLDELARTEKQIQTDIFTSIDTFLASPSGGMKDVMQGMLRKHRKLVDDDAYKDFFLTIERDYEGQKSKPVAKDHTERRGLFSTQGLFETKPAKTNATPGQTRSTCGTPRDIPEPPPGPVRQLSREYAPKKQYRVIFKEECVPVGEMKKLADVIEVLQQTLIPLQLLLGAGWVHRDISSGNVLAYKQSDGSWKAKVSDLEYAKKFPPDPESPNRPSGDPKTGTPYFMAHEILDLRYIRPLKKTDNSASIDDLWDEDVQVADGGRNGDDSSTKSQRRAKTGAIIHNYQHDLEAIYWLFLWTVVDRIPHSLSHSYSKKVFTNSLTLSPDRIDAFSGEDKEDIVTNLKPSIAYLAIPLNVMRRKLYNTYDDREASNTLNDPTSYVQIYDEIERVFERLNLNRSSWVNEDLFSRQEIARQLYGKSTPTQQGNGAGTMSLPRRLGGKRAHGSHVRPPRSQDSYTNSHDGETQSEDSTSEWEGSRSAKRQRAGR